MICSLGIIGTGHLSKFVCEGLRASGWNHPLIISPHNLKSAELFHNRFNATIAETNQQVVDQTDAVFMAVRPAQMKQALSDIIWPSHHTIISAVAGFKISDFIALNVNAKIVRVMPLSAAAIMASPTIIFPNVADVVELMNCVGSVIPLVNELEFNAATANAAAYGWYFALVDEIVQANVSAGLSLDSAKRLSLETLAAAIKVSQASSKSGESILKHLATPGGITAHGLNILKERQAIENWGVAFDSVIKRLG